MGIQTFKEGMAQDKRIWIKLVKINEDETVSYETKEITLDSKLSGKATRKHLMETFGIGKDKVLKLRNMRGSLVPINADLATNSPTRPYTLEYCKRYEHVTPRPRTVSLPSYEQMLRRKLQIIQSRLDKLEETVPRLPEIQKSVLDQEIKELNSKMEFLNSRFQEVDERPWSGMFHRNPLW